MSKCKQSGAVIPRTVGDPVDVVTGASSDVTREFTLAGPLPLVWRRYYDSGQNTYAGALGWGHTHEYDRWLAFDADGIRYVSPVNAVVGFPPLRHDGEEYATDGVVLRRLSLHKYHVEERGQPSLEFLFDQSLTRAPLQRAFRANQSIAFRYGATGQLEEITDSLGRRIRVRMERGRVLALDLLDPTKNQHRALLACQYDAAGNLVECKDPYGHASRFRYDRSNRLIAATDRRGFTFLYEYDATGRCVRSRGEDGVLDVQLRYHPQARYTIVTQADGGEWTYFYNEAAALTQVIDPYGGVVKYQFDDEGRTAAEVDPNGNVTPFIYDPAGGLVGKPPVAPWGIDQGAALAAQGFVSCPLVWACGTMALPGLITLPAANDPALAPLPEAVLPWVQTLPGTGGRKGASIMQRGSPVLSVSLRKNDSLMNIRQRVARISRDPLFDGRVYDDFGTLVKEVGPYGHERLWSHDAVGNVLRYHDYDGCRTANEYISWNHLRQTTDPMGHAVAYQYTANEKIAAVRDPGSLLHERGYDRKDRLVEIRRNGALRERRRYDAADNLVEMTAADGRRLVQIEIGPGNRPKQKRFGSGAVESFRYDEQGRLTDAVSASGKCAFAYDADGNRTADLRDGQGVRRQFRFGDLAALTVLGKFTTRYREEAGRIRAIEDPSGRIHRVRVLPHGIVLRTAANQAVEVTQYDRRGQCVLQVVTHPWAMPKPWSRAYYYSGEGDLVSVKDSEAGATRYGYDEAHRLIQATLPSQDASVVATEQHYGYDAANNLLQQPGLKGAVVQDGNRLAAANGDHFDYNERDHIAARRGALTTIHYRYDDADRLSECELPTGCFRANYDPFARRTRKEFNETWTTYYWDGGRLAAEVRHDGRLRVYVYADADALVPLAFVDYDSVDADPAAGRSYAVFTNQIGTPVLVQDDKGAAVWNARHMPYGLTRVSSRATVELNLRMPGHYFDRETGLHDNRHRHYSPELGRYLQSDPSGIDGGLNLYAYPASPLAHVDVQGLTCSDQTQIMRIIMPGELIDSGAVTVDITDRRFNEGVMADLRKIAGTKTGQKLFHKLIRAHQEKGTRVKIKPLPENRQIHKGGGGPYEGGNPAAYDDNRNQVTPTNSVVAYNPGVATDRDPTNPRYPSDVALVHELDHSTRTMTGQDQSNKPPSDGTTTHFPNAEEERAVATENAYRKEQNLPLRQDDNGVPDYYAQL